MLLLVVFTLSFVACGGASDPELKSIDVTTGVPPTTNNLPRHLKDKVTTAGRVTLETNSDCPADFVLNVEGDEPIKILQLTDTQMIDPTQVTNGHTLPSRYTDPDKGVDYCIYDICDYVIEQTQPDLILITGDYVYGDYDPNGTLFRQQTDYFDSKGIFWAPMFGNHDGDSDSNFATWIDPEYPEWYTRKQTEYLNKRLTAYLEQE